MKSSPAQKAIFSDFNGKFNCGVIVDVEQIQKFLDKTFLLINSTVEWASQGASTCFYCLCGSLLIKKYRASIEICVCVAVVDRCS